VVYIRADDVGFAPWAARLARRKTRSGQLAKNGVRYNNFHTTALCSPSRSCFLTGRNHHSNAMAGITEISTGFPGYNAACRSRTVSCRNADAVWLVHVRIGKWHLTPAEDMSLASNRKWWPLGRGFDRYYGFLGGDTDSILSVADLRQSLRQGAENAGGRVP